MATINFPSNPILGQRYIYALGSEVERTYVFKAGLSGTASDGYWSSNAGHVIRKATLGEIESDAAGDIYINPETLSQSKYGDLLTHDHDAQYLKLTGGSLTGDLEVGGSDSPFVGLSPNLAGGVPAYIIRDAAGNIRTAQMLDETTGDLTIVRYDALGAPETVLTLSDDGNVAVNGAAPLLGAHLTRKDYVDTKLAKTNGVATALFETVIAIPGTDIDVSASGWQTKTLAGNTTFTFSGWPALGQGASVIVEIIAVGTELLTFTGAVFKDPPVLAVGLNTFVFTSSDAGATINGYIPRDGA